MDRAGGHYERLMAINREAFEDGNRAVAAHALAAALHCAAVLGDVTRIDDAWQRADAQRRGADSAALPVYEAVARQAHLLAEQARASRSGGRR